MPLNRNTLIRLTTIDRCLQNRFRQWTLNDLMEACGDALYEYEGRTDGVSRRTIQGDIQLMRSEKLGYNAPIIVVDKKYYTYEDKNYSISNIPLSGKDLNTLSQAMDVLKHFQFFSQFSPVTDIINRLEDHISVTTKHSIPAIDLEKNNKLKGLTFVSELYQAITEKQSLNIRYQSFKATRASQIIVSPYLLKEYRNRWFLVCYKTKTHAIATLALDRMVEVQKDKELKFKENTFFDPEHYFDDVIGVTKTNNSPASTVVLLVDANQAPYVLTKPIHESQQLIEQRTDGSIVVSLNVVQNFELEREILGFAEHVEVLKPRILRHRIYTKLQIACLRYNKEE